MQQNQLEKKTEEDDEEFTEEDYDEKAIHYVEPENDEKLQKYLSPKPYKTVDSLLSPLKRELYLKNVKQNGFYKNNQVIEHKKSGASYKLNLTREEIQALEPSIYLRSWRIKSSVKKVNIVLRSLKDLPLKKAITQLHFLNKKVSRDIVEMLERALDDAKKMHYDPEKLYVAESWVHTDGRWQKRVECKGRGRSGIIRHRWVSVRVLLKTDQTLKRLAYESQLRQDNKKVVSKLDAIKIRGISPGFYKW
ncbi:unnamed protein product [Ambrosiozyma monospora]|uniref:Unnamed protein product n=1 Tax=Ambrosiozyma monospora TaxID=43982 RepID=A0ACB5T214_AMBMO|nr:unnamed protein product [Ambrosiozyma monospora]